MLRTPGCSMVFGSRSMAQASSCWTPNTQQILASSGVVANPGYGFLSDSNKRNGLYYSSTDKVAVAASGSPPSPEAEVESDKFVDMADAWMRENPMRLRDNISPADYLRKFARVLDAELIAPVGELRAASGSPGAPLAQPTPEETK